MPLALLIMFWIGVAVGVAGLPVLLAPSYIRAALGWSDTPQLVYVLRIVGTMLSALGLILIVFSTAFWRYSA